MEDDKGRQPDVPEADAAEQEKDWVESEPKQTLPKDIDVDVPEADALDQARDVAIDDEDR